MRSSVRRARGSATAPGLRALVVALLGSTVPSGHAVALPLQVLAKTRVELSASGDADEFTVSARLLDDLGHGLAERDLELSAGSERWRGRSGRDGRVPPWQPRVVPGPLELRAHFAGDRRGYAAGDGTLGVEVAAPRPRLQLTAAARVGPEEGLVVRARALRRERGVPDLALSLQLDDAAPLPARSGPEGAATWRLAPEALARTGYHRLVLRSAAGQGLAEASVSRRTLRWGEARLEFGASLERGILDDRVLLRGRLRADGQALPGRELVLDSGAKAWSVRVDERGEYEAGLATTALGPGAHDLAARFAGEPGLAPVVARTSVTLPPPRARPRWPRALIAGLTAAALLVLGLRRALPWLLGRWEEWRRRPRRGSSPAPGEWQARPSFEPLVAAEVGGGPEEDPLRFVGVLWDRSVGGAIAGGWLELAAAPDAPSALRTQSGPGGEVDLRAPAPGAWWLRGSAPGYLPEQWTLRFGPQPPPPARLGLLPVREAVGRVWLEAARDLTTARPLWPLRTPQQVLGGLRPRPRAFAALSALLERVYFGPGPAAAGEGQRAAELAAAARHERGAGDA